MDILDDFDLTPFNTFAVASRSRAFCRVKSQDDLLQGLDYAAREGLPVLVLGGGSNVLFSGDYPGLVLHMEIAGVDLADQNGSTVTLQVGAGENWHQFVQKCLRNQLYGLENLILIPGTVGAAPIQNIGAYGVELASCFVSLTALEVNSGDLWTFDKEACRFGYRDSVFKHSRTGELIITSVSLELRREASPDISYQALQDELERRYGESVPDPLQVAETVMSIRRSKLPDPRVLPNCGSFFKNPVIDHRICEQLRERYREVPLFPAPGRPGAMKVPAAWLLDRAGWKGRRQGAAGVHRDQAVVLVNHGGASGAELLTLARDMQQSVMEQYGIALEPEVRII